MSTATFTELLRHPNEVVAKTEQGAVRITRRDAEDLVLLRAGDLEGQDQGRALASQIMRAAVAHEGDMLGALKDIFGWMAVLDDKEQREFATKMDGLVWSSAELGAYGLLLNTYRSWRGTAEAIADGMTPLPQSEILPEDERPWGEYPG